MIIILLVLILLCLIGGMSVEEGVPMLVITVSVLVVAGAIWIL
jgi:hypothetical protein